MDDREFVSRVYAGVLGKIIGVYMGRPFENWSFKKIAARFGEISSYVNDELGVPLVVTDDDISGTFTFIRALEDYGFDAGLRSESVGQTWLNYLVEKRTVLWWGGLGNSTEHTAYLRLKEGHKAPRSGSVALNGPTTANQIGAMIFIDGWAMVCPGEPGQAARFAREAASVSHDDEAVHAAVMVAVIESMAFVETGLDALLDAALSYIPGDSTIARLTREIRAFRAQEPDWRAARSWLDDRFGDRYFKGTVHVVPNFGLILLSLLYGDGDFRRSMMIVNTSGRDTDCNAGNVGCILGIRNGLAALEACPDLREPHRDLMFISSADGGRGVTDAAREAYTLVNAGRRLHGKPILRPKDGARYHFALAGSLHGFHVLESGGSASSIRLKNVLLPRAFQTVGSPDARALEIALAGQEQPVRVAVPVFIPPEARDRPGYEFQACPQLHPGHTVTALAHFSGASTERVSVRVFVSAYGRGDKVEHVTGPAVAIESGGTRTLEWTVDIGRDGPIFETGIELSAPGALTGTVYLDRLDWRGVPDCTFRRTHEDSLEWKRAWVNGVDEWLHQFPESFHISQDRGTGLLIQGGRDWEDYEVSASLVPFLSEEVGLAVRVQGMKRFYALILCPGGRILLVKELDGRTVLAEAELVREEFRMYDLQIRAAGTTLVAAVDGKEIFRLEDSTRPLESGAIGLLVTEGTLACDAVSIRPLTA